MFIFGIILLVALLIPVLSIVLDSPVGRALARRVEGPESAPASVADLAKRVDLLESEVDDLTHNITQLREENAFLQRLLEEAPPRQSLPPSGPS